VCVCVCVCVFEHNSGTPGAISNKLGTHTAVCMCKTLMLKLKLICDRRSVGQCVLVSGSCLEPMTRSLCFVWQLWVSSCSAPSLTRGGSVIYSYNCFWALPEQLLSGPSPAELVTIFYSFTKSKSKLLYDWRSVSQYVLVSGTPLGPMTRFYFFLSFDSYVYIIYIYIPQGEWCGRPGIWMIHIVKEIKLLLLLGNRLKHMHGNVRYLVTWFI
jgi:hypothetical protein